MSTFRAALEQAEQQFTAAAVIGYESRPVNLFYGLSQAGRAIAAASKMLSGDDWLLEGHGILAREMNAARSVGDVKLHGQSGNRGSFQRLSRILDSPTPAGESTKNPVAGAMADPWTIGDVWPYLVEARGRAQLDPATTFLPLDVMTPREVITPGQANYNNGAHGVTVPLPATATQIVDKRTLEAFVNRYPSFNGRQELVEGGEYTQFDARWPNDDDRNPTVGPDTFILYRGTRYAFPALLSDARAVHPLMAWWAVLFGLSMLSRYQPDQWTKMINVDAHEQATSVEYILDQAISAVPDLIDETIAEVSS